MIHYIKLHAKIPFKKNTIYQISSNKRPGAYFKFQLKGQALIGRRALYREEHFLNFPL